MFGVLIAILSSLYKCYYDKMEKTDLVRTGFKLLLKQERSLLWLNLEYSVSWLQFASWTISDHFLLNLQFCIQLHRSSTWYITGKLFFSLLKFFSKILLTELLILFFSFLESNFDPDLLHLPNLYFHIISIYNNQINQPQTIKYPPLH